MPSAAELNVILIEDNLADADVVTRALQDAGFAPRVQRVETEGAFLAALESEPELIISDCESPALDSLRALDLLHGRGLDTPFILLSGKGEGERLVTAIRRGADDFLLKGNLGNLQPVVDRALKSHAVRDDAKRTAAEWRRLADRQAAVLDVLPAHIALLDERGVIVAVNAAWRRFATANGAPSGYESVGSNYLEVCDAACGPCSEEANAVAAGIRAVLNEERTDFSLEYPCHGPNDQRWFLLTVTPLNSKYSSGVVVAHLEITARKLMENALKESEARHRLLFMGNPMPGWVYDLETLRFLAVNDAAVAKYGYTREEFLAMTIKDIRPPEDVPDLLKNIGRVTVGLSQSGVWRHRLKDGRIIQVEINSHVMEISGRREELVLANDVTERLQAEAERQHALARESAARQEAEAARRHYQSLFEYAPGSYLVLQGDDYRIVAVSEAYLQATMTQRDQIQGRGLFTVFPDMPDDPAADGVKKLRASLERVKAFARSDVMPVQRYPIRRPESEGGGWEERYWSAVNTPVPGPDGGIAFIIHRAEDVTEFVRARQKAGEAVTVEEAQKALDSQSKQVEADIVLRSFELKRANEELARSQTLLRIASQAARLGGWSLNLQPEKLNWSDETCVIHDRRPGYRPTVEEGIAYYAPEYRTMVADCIKKSLTTGEPFQFEAELITAKGRRIWVRASGEPVRDEQGKIRSLQGAVQDITERREQAERTRRLAERLHKTLESITDGFFTLGKDWTFTYLNPMAERLMGRSAAALLGRVLWEEFPAAVGTDFERNYRRAMQEQVTVHFDEFYPEPLNAWYEVRAYPSEEGLAVYFLDVTEQRRQEEILRASDERFRLLAKATNDAIWDWDLTTEALWWSDGFEALFGFDRDEVEPTIESWTNRIHPEDRAAVETTIRQAIDGGAAGWSDEYRFQRKDGTHAYVLDRGNIIRDADGRALRMIGGMTDITERREIEERLREQASLLDAAHDAIMVRDLEHRILYLNRSSEQLYGWNAAGMLGRSSRELLHVDQSAFDAAMQQLMADGQWSGEFTQVRCDGGLIEIESSWTLLRDEQQAPKSVLVINTDVTERKKLEQQFLRAQRMESIGTLAGGIAHDLNNLLAPIMMGVELLKQYQPAPASRQLIENIERSARRGADLVKQVLSFARGVEGSRVPVQLKHIVRDVEQILASTLPKNICVTCDHADNLWPVLGDPTQLNQVLLNLSVNARDAMPDGGQLTMTLSNREFDEHYAVMNRGVAAGRYVVVEVADTGCGIPREILDRIFDPFFTTKEVGKGTGLGLSTVQGIVRSHGGFINVYSEEGKGTTFRVGLPALTEESEDEGTRHPLGDRLPRGHGELILVVDDETSILQITKQTLEAFGYRVLTAEDGAQAVGVFALQPQAIALVLTDMMMPVMDGPALIAVLKRIRADVRIIASSGLNANGRVALAAGQGIWHFIPKPYSAETMLQKIKLALHDGNHAAL